MHTFPPFFSMIPDKRSCVGVPLAHRVVVRTIHDVDVVMQENKVLPRPSNWCFEFLGLSFSESVVYVARGSDSSEDTGSWLNAKHCGVPFGSRTKDSTMIGIARIQES